MIFGVFINRLLLKSPLTDAPQVNRYTLLITALGMEIVALTLHYRFYFVTIVADRAKGLSASASPIKAESQGHSN